MNNQAILYKALEEIGTKETKGKGDNPRVVEYHKASTIDNVMGSPDSVPWCASFVCWVLEEVGIKSTNSKMARSFEKLGREVDIKDYIPGDVMTFYRNGYHSGQGHVGFIIAVREGHVYLLGGNQSDEVNVTKYSLDKMTSIRRVSDEPVDIKEIQRVTLEIMKTNVRVAGSVV